VTSSTWVRSLNRLLRLGHITHINHSLTYLCSISIHVEANEATRSFAQTYNQSLKDDDDEFAYLNKETQLDDVLTTSRQAGGDNEEDYEDDEEEEELPQTISTHEVRRQLREAAEEGQDVSYFCVDLTLST
jgi:hypothetical protein